MAAKSKRAKLILPDEFDDAKYGDEDERDPNDIELATQGRTHIPNFQRLDNLTRLELSELRDLEKKYAAMIQRRGGPNPVYNCHGLTFASRRTKIIDDATLFMILKEDDYQQISKDKVKPGDVVLYFSTTGNVEHSGIVVELPNHSDPLERHYPMVVSKWGSGPEYLHRANQCEYSKGDIRYYRIGGA